MFTARRKLAGTVGVGELVKFEIYFLVEFKFGKFGQISSKIRNCFRQVFLLGWVPGTHSTHGIIYYTRT